MDNKRVLVEIGSNRRPVVFKPESGRELVELKQAVVESFRDVLSTTDIKDLLLQIKSEEWGGEFVDVLDTDAIPDKSIIKARVTTVEVAIHDSHGTRVYFSFPPKQRTSSDQPPTTAIKASAAVTSTSAESSGLTQVRLTFSQEQQVGLRRPLNNVCKSKLELTFC